MLDYDDQLARSCGQVRPMILHARHQDRGTVSKYVITKPYAIVGRNSSCDICLHHEDVSKQHAYLQVLDGRLFCIDQGSRHGIFWKETPQLYGWMYPGQPIEIGPYSLTLEQPVGELTDERQLRNTAPFFARYIPEVNPSQAYLVINGNRRFELHHQLALIGSRDHCNIILDTREISPIHASVVRTQDGKHWLVVPIGIKVKVNHKRCVSMELHDGDIIAVGNHTLTFQAAGNEAGSVSTTSSSIRLVALDDNQPSSSPATPPPSVIEIETDTHRALEQAFDRLSAPDISLDDELHQGLQGGYPLVPVPPAELVPLSSAMADTRAKPTQAISERGQDLPAAPGAQDTQMMTAFLDHMKLMQQEMMTQMRMNMEMMAKFMVNLQQKHMEQVREEMNHLSKINQELLQLRQSLLASKPTPDHAVTYQPVALPAKSAGVEQRAMPAAKAPSKPKDPSPHSSEPDINPSHSHDWITKRIAHLEGERLSRWEKMKHAMFGK
jgi:pSer/pThr/pTyr-binding forkhead associated (FHA) protein